MNATETQPAKNVSPSMGRNLSKTAVAVDRRIEDLQKGVLNDKASARAALAKLRRGVNTDPGEIADIWDYTHVNDVPDSASDAPTPEETAVHITMTLYAVHQQSRSGPMHKPGFGFGRAARELIGREDENPSARSRFNALVTASTVDELRSHLRSFVQLLRSKDIGFDYAAFADDLVMFRRSGGDKKVRRRWSRDFYNLRKPDGNEAESVDVEASASSSLSSDAK